MLWCNLVACVVHHVGSKLYIFTHVYFMQVRLKKISTACDVGRCVFSTIKMLVIIVMPNIS